MHKFYILITYLYIYIWMINTNIKCHLADWCYFQHHNSSFVDKPSSNHSVYSSGDTDCLFSHFLLILYWVKNNLCTFHWCKFFFFFHCVYVLDILVISPVHHFSCIYVYFHIYLKLYKYIFHYYRMFCVSI